MLQHNKIEEEYEKLLKVKAISENKKILSSIRWQKAVNDLNLAQGLLNISSDNKIKESLNYSKDITFFDWVIVSSYYSISHSSQALLGVKNIKINNRLHHATLVAFAKQFIINAELERELFLIYEDAEEKARELLEIFEKEKIKRGKFQYHRLSKSNLEPAKKSIENAKIFLNAIEKVLGNKKVI